jgi:hypothetical protein
MFKGMEQVPLGRMSDAKQIFANSADCPTGWSWGQILESFVAMVAFVREGS